MKAPTMASNKWAFSQLFQTFQKLGNAEQAVIDESIEDHLERLH